MEILLHSTDFLFVLTLPLFVNPIYYFKTYSGNLYLTLQPELCPYGS